MYKKCLPSGRKKGQRSETPWLVNPVLVTGVDAPPSARTFAIAPQIFAANTMVFPGPQLPPRASGASQMVTGDPPFKSICQSLPCMKNATAVPSGDQKGK